DDWEEFNKVGQAVWWKDELETRALKESDRCIAISPTLKEKFSDLRHDVLCIPNGLRTVFRSEKFISSRAKRVDGKIVIGYFGHLTDAWFDWEGLIALADSNTKIIIEIIGYGEPDWVREKISHLENIRLIGFVPAEKLHQYMPEWHIGVIPFLNTALTKAVDPIKIYEYLYYGLPVIASGMEHLKSYPETKVISSWANASGIIENIYTQIVSGEIDYSAISDFCEHSRWRNRFEAMVG
ncbi:glycosyltransferase, partial [Nostoc sp. CHAB 5844]|nr:glycosyltransferase [Nostoc sp. CHAB 5844]